MAGPNAGRSGSVWRRLSAAQRAKHLPCWVCGQPIDYSLKWPAPGSYSTDHDKPWSKYPELREDPGNLRSSHLGCNWSKSDRESATPVLGNLSETF